jgi:hypothetical protein
MCDAQTEKDVIFENTVHNLFLQTRQKQQEKTLWNGRNGRDPKFAVNGSLGPEEMKRPKMQSAEEFIKQ